MSRKDIQAYIKKLNPQNKSGTIKEALNMLQELKKVTGMSNPLMTQAVGAASLAAAMKQVSQDFAAPVDPVNQDALTLEKILRKLGPRYGLLVDDVIKLGKELLGYLQYELVLQCPKDTLDKLSADIRALTEIEPIVFNFKVILDNSLIYIHQIRDLQENHGA